MKTKVLKYGVAVLAILFLNACASTGTGNLTMRGMKAESVPPATAAKVGDVKAGQFTHDYWVIVYPGVGEKFNPNPRLTLTEYNHLVQLDWYCTKGVSEEFEGKGEEMIRQAITYGSFQGILGALGARLAFGPMIGAADYLAYIGMTGVGGGLGSGKITYEMALSVAHGYCMTLMTYKADRLEGALGRIAISPVYTGKARVPSVSDAPAPSYPNAGRAGAVLPPPR